MKIVNLKIKDLKPYEKNAKTHPKENIEAIKKSIQKYGFADPIGVWGKQNIIVEGHGRYLACKELGIDEVPCIRLDHLTDEERREYTLLHNKTTMMSDFDLDLLGEELFDIDMSDFELDWGIVQDDGFGTDFELPSGDKGNIQQITFTLSNMQADLVNDLISKIQKTDEFKQYNESRSDNANKNGNALYLLLAKINLEE